MSGRFATDIHIGEITNHARFTYSTASNLMSVSRPLLLPRSPELSNEAATKGYVDTAVVGGGNHDHPEYEPAKFIKVEDDIKIGNDIRFVDSSGNDVCRLKYQPDGCEVDGHIFPDGTREFDLGKAGDEWRDIYAQFATISGGASIGSLETPLLNVTGVMSLNGNKITQVGAPDTGTDVVYKSYVDTAIANITTGTGTGIDWDNIGGETKPAMFKDEVGYNISSETFIPTLNYVYDLGTTSSRWGTLHAYGVNAYLSPINAFEGVDAKGKAIVNVADPTDSADAANKAYVDSATFDFAPFETGTLSTATTRMNLSYQTYVDRVNVTVSPIFCSFRREVTRVEGGYRIPEECSHRFTWGIPRPFTLMYADGYNGTRL
eukprot:jgi/Tetstr1/441588/TSEL_029816.t1